MANAPRYRTFLPTISKLVPKSVHVQFKQFKLGTGTVTVPEVPNPNRVVDVPSPSSDSEAAESLASEDEICILDVSTQAHKSDEDDEEEMYLRLKKSKKADPKKSTENNTNEDSLRVANEKGDNNNSEPTVKVGGSSIISLNQLDENRKIDTATERASSPDSHWTVPQENTREILELQIWRQKFEMSQTEKALLQIFAENIKDFLVNHLKTFFNYENATNEDRDMMNDLPVELFQLLKYEIQNHRKQHRPVNLESLVQSMKEYLMTAIAYRARKLRRASLADADKSKTESALCTALFDEVTHAIDRRFERLYRTTLPGLAEDELEGVQMAAGEVKQGLRQALQLRVAEEHTVLVARQVEELFEVIDKLSELLITTVFRDTEREQRTAGLLLECAYELIDIIKKKQLPPHGRTSEDICEEFISHALHILSQELNKRGVTV